jgi:AcrR family transcriptional regulator
MVSRHARPAAPGSSRARLVSAAAAEFAARGFDGATVDRIAAGARVNKAMLYYHFRNKAALYLEILRDVFDAAAEAVEAVPRSGGTPENQLRAYVMAVATSAVARPHFPPIWLRELAEGGRHLDESVIVQMRRVIVAFVAILRAGQRAGRFRDVHPLIAHMSIVGPLLVFAGASKGTEVGLWKTLWRSTEFSTGRPPSPRSSREAVIAYVQEAALAALAARGRPAAARRGPRRRGV